MTIDPSTRQEGSVPVGHVFDVDSRTGFMPPKPPVARLPAMWEEWEAMLDAALSGDFKCSDNPDLTAQDAEASASWRAKVRQVSL